MTNAPPSAPREISMPLGVVVTRRPGVTRWASQSWQPTAVLPGAAPADWKLLREDGETRDYHAATLPLTLHRADVEAYKVSLTMSPPSVFVVLRRDGRGVRDVSVHAVTASAFEAQDYQDGGEDVVEAVPMPPALIAWVSDFVGRHMKEEKFVKRRRDRIDIEKSEDGKGDARIRQESDVYRSPAGRRKREKLN